MTYRTIVVDPPWEYEGFAGSRGYGGKYVGVDGLAGVHVEPLPYSSLSVPQIEALPVHSLAADDCWLFLWTTGRYLGVAFGIIGVWGFSYAQTLVWHKTGNPSPFGGTFAPHHAEFLLTARRGSPPVLNRWPTSVIAAPKPNRASAERTHSRKPEIFLDLIEQWAPGPRVELFARRARFGWDYWGDESLQTAEMPA